MEEIQPTVRYSKKGYNEGLICDMTLQYDQDEWRLIGEIGGGCTCSDPLSFAKTIALEKVSRLLDTLSEVTLSPLLCGERGIDGAFEELTVTKGWSSCVLSWWDRGTDFMTLREIGRVMQE